MKAFVTGATGMLGSHLVEELVAKGHHIKALARPASRKEILAQVPVEWAEGDLVDLSSLLRAVKNVDIIFHTAALMRDWAPKSAFTRHNVIGTKNLLEAAAQNCVKRVIYVSTRSVMGMEECQEATEEYPYRWSNEYGASKVEAEKLVLDYHRQGKLACTVIRPTWIVGPRDRYSMPTVINVMKAGKLALINKGQALQSFVSPTDVAQAMILAAENPKSVGRIYLVDSGERKTIKEFYDVLAEEIGVQGPQKSIPYPVAYILGWIMESLAKWKKSPHAPPLTPLRVKLLGKNHSYDISRAKKELGYSPQVTLEEAVHRAVAYFKNGHP